MKVVTIGRDAGNDVVINDSKVSRHHTQIVSENGNFRIVDMNSTNGTFVNDRKINGETMLYPGETVRVGDTILQWQSYFPPSARGTKTLVWLVSAILALAVIATGSYFTLAYIKGKKIKEEQNKIALLHQKTIIKMHEEDGVRYVPVKVNGQELNFVFDTGASSICFTVLEAELLVKNGSLSREDVIGWQGMVDATGGLSIGMKVNLKKVQIGDRELTDVEATIIENSSASCLLGQTVLSRFGKYTIDNVNNEIIFEERPNLDTQDTDTRH